MLNSVYKLGNFFNIGNSFLLCCKMSSFNYSIIKRKLDHYNIISKMKNSLEKFPVIKKYQKKKLIKIIMSILEVEFILVFQFI